MKRVFLLISLLLITSCNSTKQNEVNKVNNEKKIFQTYDNSELDIPKVGENENFNISSMKVKYASIPGEFKIKTKPLNKSVKGVINELGENKIDGINAKIVSKVEINNEYFKNKEIEMNPDGIYDIAFNINSKNGYKGKINIYPFDLDNFYGTGYTSVLPNVIVFDNTKIPYLNIDHEVKFEKRKFNVVGEPINENTIPQKEIEVIYPYYSVEVDFKKGNNYFDFEIIKDSQTSILGEKGFIYEQ